MEKAPNIAMRGQPKMKLEVPVSTQESSVVNEELVVPGPSMDACQVHCMCSVHKIADNCCQGETEQVEETCEAQDEDDSKMKADRLQLINAALPEFESGKSSTFITLTTGDGAALVIEQFTHQLGLILAEKQGDEVKRCSILLDRDDLRTLQDAISRIL